MFNTQAGGCVQALVRDNRHLHVIQMVTVTSALISYQFCVPCGFNLRGCPDILLSLSQFCVCLASEWSPAGLACFLCPVASRSFSLVSVILDSVSLRELLISKGTHSRSQLSVSVGWEQCMVWLRVWRKGWATENLSIPSCH